MSWQLGRADVPPPPAGKNTLAERGLPPVDHLTPPEELKEKFSHLQNILYNNFLKAKYSWLCVSDPGCLSWILIFIRPGSRI
jgi:hypothetical protein